MWTNEYVGIPYKEFGRDRSGVDCWGLAHLVYKEKYGIYLPSFDTNYTVEDRVRIDELISQYKEGWQPVENPKVGDLVLFNVLGSPTHLGIVSEPNHFIHSREGKDVAVERLDSFSWSKRIQGYYRYNKNTSLVLNAVPHPLKTTRYTLPVLPGTTLQQVFDNINQHYNISNQLKGTAVIIVNGKPIDKGYWSHFILNQDDVIEYRAVPRGDNTFRLVAMLAIAIAAPYIVAAIAGPGVGVLGTVAMSASGVATFTATTVLGNLAIAAVSMVGGLLINAIAPIRPPEQNLPGASEKLLLVTGGSNRGNPYEAIPVVLGKVRVTPPLGAVNYITYEGESDNYLRMLLIWGYGPLSIDESTFKIGNSDFTSFTDIEKITLDRQTEPTEETLTSFNSLYGQDISQTYSGVELTCDERPSLSTVQTGTETREVWLDESTTTTVEYPVYGKQILQASVPGEPVTTSFSIDTELGPGESLSDKKVTDISIAIHFPQGLKKIDKEGNESSTQVYFSAQYSVDGGAFNSLGTIIISGKKNDGFTKVQSYYFSSGLSGQIQVQVRRLHSSKGDDSDPNDPNSKPDWRFAHTSVLGTVTLRRNLKPTRDPNNTKIAKTALKIKASDQLSNNIEGINGIVQTWSKVWNGSNWNTYGTTNNPAALFLYVLTHQGNARRISENKIDLEKLGYWYNYCATKGFQYNSVLGSQKSILEVLRDISAAGRASPAMVDGKWTVNIDEPKNTIVQHFTPHNSWSFEGTKSFRKFPDALRVTYYDEDQNYQESEVIIPYAGFSSLTAEVFESIQLPGVTKRSLVIDHARWHMAQAKLRPEVYTLNTDIEYLVCNRGDRVKVTHDVPLWGLATGRIKNRIDSQVFDLDEELPLEYLKDYTIRIRSSAGGTVTRNIQKDFIPVSASLIAGIATINFNTTHPFKPGSIINVQTTFTGINGQNIEVTEVTSSTIKYLKSGAYTPSVSVGGTVKLTDGYYSRIKVTQTSTTSEIDSEDLFLFGELNKESQDLIILNIETSSNKTAKLTLVDYGVTDTYNIFDDYLNYTALPDFETQISLPPLLTRNNYKDNEKPIVVGIFSGSLNSILVGSNLYTYAIKVSYVNPDEKVNTKTQYVECEYIDTQNDDGLESRYERVPFIAGSVILREVEQGRTYKIRLRYIGLDGSVGPWTLWTDYLVQAFDDTGLIGLTVFADRVTRYLDITPSTTDNLLPVDFKHYEFKVFKNETNVAFWDTEAPEDLLITKIGASTTRFNLRDFATPRLSEQGIKFRIACRMVGTMNNYLTDIAITNVYLTNL